MGSAFPQCHVAGRPPLPPPPEGIPTSASRYGQPVGGTHPNGMHTCLFNVLELFMNNNGNEELESIDLLNYYMYPIDEYQPL